MFGSEALEVAMGLALVFLLVSLMLTALIEVIESVLKTRAADLERAIKLMLDPHNKSGEAVESFYSHPIVYALFKGNYTESKKSWFFGREKGGNLPSYIPRDIFSAVALDLESAGKAGSVVAGVIESYRRLYGDDVDLLKANLESWYDGVMDRVAGWYKRRTQKLLFWLGLALAIAMNINPIVIGQHLSATPTARAKMVDLAEATVQEGPPGDAAGGEQSNKERLRDLDKAVREIGLPIGWNAFAIDRSFPHASGTYQFWIYSVPSSLFGWVMTAVAATLGAPFWFDVLNKLMVIRATVKPKEKSRDEASEDRTRPIQKNEEMLPGKTGPIAGRGNSAPSADRDGSSMEDHADGCLDGHEVPAHKVTRDIDLPPATGGIRNRD